MGCATKDYNSIYYTPPIDPDGDGVFGDIFEVIGRTITTGTYSGGEDWTLAPYNDAETLTVTVTYNYSIPDGGGATLDDALVGMLDVMGTPTVVDSAVWDTVTVSGFEITDFPLYWEDGDSGSTIPQFGSIQLTATITDPTAEAVYSSIRGSVSTEMTLSGLIIAIQVCGENVHSAQVAPATCDIVGLTEEELGYTTPINFSVSFGATERAGTEITVPVTVTSEVSASAAAVMFVGLFVSDEFTFEGAGDPACISIPETSPLEGTYTGGTGPALDVGEADGGLSFGTNDAVDIGDTWEFSITINTSLATCPVSILQVFYSVEDALVSGYQIGYAKVDCCPEYPEAIGEPIPVTSWVPSLIGPALGDVSTLLSTGWVENPGLNELDNKGRMCEVPITLPAEATGVTVSVSARFTLTDSSGLFTNDNAVSVFLMRGPIGTPTPEPLGYEFSPSDSFVEGVPQTLSFTTPVTGSFNDLNVVFVVLASDTNLESVLIQGAWLVDNVVITVNACDVIPTLESPALEWHTPGSRIFETGIDRGAIYLADGRVVPWNGLTAVNESFGQETEPVFYDGVKISDIQSSQGFSASVSAITYPDELEEACGGALIRNGFHLWDQPPQSFGFTYRTIVGNDLKGIDAGYKLHLVYNVSATTSDRSYDTISDDIELTEFEWDFMAVPEHVDSYRPSTHIVFDTTKTTPSLIEAIQNYIWGTETSPPTLPPLNDIISLVLNQNNFINITDNGDGTWTASTDAVGYINDLGDGVFEIQEANIVTTGSTTYLISPTPDPP